MDSIIRIKCSKTSSEFANLQNYGGAHISEVKKFRVTEEYARPLVEKNDKET